MALWQNFSYDIYNVQLVKGEKGWEDIGETEKLKHAIEDQQLLQALFFISYTQEYKSISTLHHWFRLWEGTARNSGYIPAKISIFNLVWYLLPHFSSLNCFPFSAINCICTSLFIYLSYHFLKSDRGTVTCGCYTDGRQWRSSIYLSIPGILITQSYRIFP